jgi:ribosomal protein L11 methyltransferase
MCLRWIAHQVASGPCAARNPLGRVLDYGCGSGILAIAAAKHGAMDVVAVDIDRAAIQATVLNAQANQVQVAVGLPMTATGVYQTVLANILAAPLKTLAAQLCSLAAPQGSLVLSGILKDQADGLIAAYAPFCQLEIADEEDGWILMTATR